MSYKFPKHPDLAKEVSAFLSARPLKPTRFGKDALNDAMLLAQLEKGRELRQDSIEAIRRYMLTGQPSGPRPRSRMSA